jgi:oxygen-independent coproporphyrinogen-3 oxidase
LKDFLKTSSDFIKHFPVRSNLIHKYNVAGPRYTSYPTVPYWDGSTFFLDGWKQKIVESFNASAVEGISLYIHLPFCESLCTYCGCTTRITVNHAVEEPYIEAVLKEWKLYVDLFPGRPKIKELHLGGGTPTFFSASNLQKLMNGLLAEADMADEYEFGFEGHPNHTSDEQLQALHDFGFRRASFGIQDFDERVQYIIHREQSYEQVKHVTEAARGIGYTSVNYDLIYGLPLQKMESIVGTINKVRELKPDRIAFYSYAHVPWIKRGQRRFTEMDLPQGEEKRALYERGRGMLEEAGYMETGMDHFSLKTDSLYEAAQAKKLHRNFMGYTTAHTQLLVGLGVSSISDSWMAFAQNVKTVEEYEKLVNMEVLPVFRGHILTDEDLILRRHILNLMCSFETDWEDNTLYHPFLEKAKENLEEMERDGLVEITFNRVSVTKRGKPFVRNVCMAFDALLWRKAPETELFSATV